MTHTFKEAFISFIKAIDKSVHMMDGVLEKRFIRPHILFDPLIETIDVVMQIVGFSVAQFRWMNRGSAIDRHVQLYQFLDKTFVLWIARCAAKKLIE